MSHDMVYEMIVLTFLAEKVDATDLEVKILFLSSFLSSSYKDEINFRDCRYWFWISAIRLGLPVSDGVP